MSQVVSRLYYEELYDTVVEEVHFSYVCKLSTYKTSLICHF